MSLALGGITRVALALSCMFALAACAAPLDSVGGSTTRPTPTRTESAAPVPTASPEPSGPGTRPASRVPLGCEQLIGGDALGSRLGLAPGAVSPVVHPLANGSAASWQAGMLNCEWSSSADTEGPRLTVEILFDAVDEYFDFLDGLPLADSQLGLIGPDSRINCYAGTEGSSCSASFLADGYWVNFEFSRPAADPAPTIEETRTVAVAAGTAIRDSLQAAGEPLPQFQPPADSLAAWDDCAVVDGDGSFRTALGSPSLGEAEARDAEGAIAMFAIAWQRANFLSCDWRHADPYESPAGELRLLGVNILPGGGWAWPELSEVALARDGATEVAIEGAEQAVASCIWDDEYSGCTVEALVDGSYLWVDTAYDEAADGSARERAVEAMGLLISRLG